MRTFPLHLLMPMALALAAVRGHGAVEYARDVAPILRARCAPCHHDAEREGEFSVETFASLRRGGERGDPVHAGDPGGSLLVRLVEGSSKPSMPPKEEPRVPAAEVEVLRRWIAEGAVGPSRDVSLFHELSVPSVPAARGVRPPLTALAPLADEAGVLAGRTGALEIRSGKGARVRRTVEGIPGKVPAVHVTADGGRWVVAFGLPGLNGGARVLDARTGRVEREVGGHRDVVQDAELSPDGRWLATGGYDRKVIVWRMSDGAAAWSNSIHNGAVTDLAFDPSGKVLASASADQTVKLWRVSDGGRLGTLNQPQGEVNAVAFLPDGSGVVATGADRRIYRWRLGALDGSAIHPLAASRFAHDAAVLRMSVSPDGRWLVTAAADKSVKRWLLPDLDPAGHMPGGSEVASALAWSPDGRVAWVARMDGTVGRWPLEKAAAAAGAAGVLEPPVPRASSVPARATSAASPGPGGVEEVEPNDGPAQARRVAWPVVARGRMNRPGDVDAWRVRMRRGEQLAVDVDAARSGSRLDSRVEVLDASGHPVEQVRLQAVLDSWFTFRGKDSDTIDDFRLHNWTQMELDELLYANGEVVRLWLYPRGPDSGFKVYPGEGRRQTVYQTTPVTHALNEPAYVVRALPPGSEPLPNGLPSFRLNFENDDDPSRQRGADSFLTFVAPKDGEYVVRITDTRGFGGPEGFGYAMALRPPRPDFEVKVEGLDPKVSRGSGREVRFVVTRREGFDGPVRIHVEGLPQGFEMASPVEVEAGQVRASAVLWASPEARSPATNDAARVRLVARADVGHDVVERALGGLGNLTLGDAAKVAVEVLPGPGSTWDGRGPLELEVRPGQTVRARVRATRAGFDGRIELGGDDAGRNLPHGVFVDNVGLNGLLIVEGQVEREFFVTAARKVRPQTRWFHLRATADGGQCSRPVRIRVLGGVESAGP
jgi:WD40 repeat protein